MAGTLVDYIVKYKTTLGGPGLAGGDPLKLMLGTVVLKNGTDSFALDLSDNIKNLIDIQFGCAGGYVIGYDYTNKVFVVYGQKISGGATGPLIAITGTDLGVLAIPFCAYGY
jgi:hypothetical protein